MQKKHLLFYFLICILLSPPTMAVDQNNHVRVVLDISKSLSIKDARKGWPTDPKRLAILATILLYDLALPNPSLGDSFEVIPFDQGKNWKWISGEEPPKSTRPAIKIKPGEQRANFVAALNNLKYDGNYTYFYPGLLRAIEDLKATATKDVKTLIFITDGLPEKATREQEVQLIQDDLIPLIEKHNIHLYILAFGKEAYKNKTFFEKMEPEDFLSDKNGNNLLQHMITIFSSNFGFTFVPPRTVKNVKSLDLEGNVVPPRVAVIVYSNRASRKPPTLTLSPPAKGNLNAPDGIQSAREKGGSYSLEWVLSPDKGRYKFKTNIRKASVAILRPSHVELEVLPYPPYTTQTDWVLAKKEQRFKILVKSPTGAKGDPGEVKLSYTPFGKNIPDPLGDKLAPPPSSAVITENGRTYDIVVHFPKHPQNPEKDYAAYLELEAYRGKAKVGGLQHHLLVKASGIFIYTGGAVEIDLGKLGVNSINCQALIFKTKPQHQGAVDFELESLKRLPWGHRLEIRSMPGAQSLETDKGFLSITEKQSIEVCLKTGEKVGSSTALGEEWLEFRVKNSHEPEHRVPIQLRWQVKGLTFWERWGTLILSILGIILFLIILMGIFTPQRFSSALAVAFVRERDELDDQSPLPIKQWKGVGSGFFRNARAFLQPDYRLSGKKQGALAGLYAEKGGNWVKGGSLYRETLDGEWEIVAERGRRIRPGDVFRIGDNGPFFRIAVRGK